jgi:dihydrofolate synthase/folylpolyglutamate synthase
VTWSLERAEDHLLSLELFGMNFGLERMRRLLAELGDPQERLRAIHVVGTNGKSSTVRFAAALLQASGLRTGAYLSPHLTSFAERVLIDGEDVAPDAFGAAVERAAAAAEAVEGVTQFELLTAAALDALARAEVEAAVIEAGLGGRYDATNVLDAPVVVLTNIGLEHTQWLGDTIAEIAGEKLAVVQPGATLVLGGDDPEVEALARATVAQIVRPEPLDVPLHGFQRANFEAAAAAVRAFGAPLRDAAAVAARVNVPGRLQLVGEDPLTIVDGAHNPAGMAALASALPGVVGDRPLVAVVSVLGDKDAPGMLRELLGKCAAVVFCASRNPRALAPETLASLAGELGGPPAEVVSEPRAAVARARELAGPDGAVLATGSIYLVADLVGDPDRRKASAL